jgi:predicted negative regulator of RcsB-dependent stress response
MNQAISFNPKQLLTWLSRSRRTLTFLIVAGLLGYTGYQISQLTNVQPSPAYITVQQAASKVPNLRGNQQVISQLKKLQSPGNTTIQVTTGKQDPFTLN